MIAVMVKTKDNDLFLSIYFVFCLKSTPVLLGICPTPYQYL